MPNWRASRCLRGVTSSCQVTLDPAFHAPYDLGMGASRIASRSIHAAMALLTLFNLMWVDAPSCCCAQSPAGAASCCGGGADQGACNCCCSRDASAAPDNRCPHCAAAEDREPSCCSKPAAPSKSSPSHSGPVKEGTNVCGAPGSCDCGQASERTTPTTTQSTSAQQSSHETQVGVLSIMPPVVATSPVISVERRNGEIASLDRPASIRFGVWRN